MSNNPEPIDKPTSAKEAKSPAPSPPDGITKDSISDPAPDKLKPEEPEKPKESQKPAEQNTPAESKGKKEPEKSPAPPAKAEPQQKKTEEPPPAPKKSPPYAPSQPQPIPMPQTKPKPDAPNLPVVGGNEFVIRGFNYLVPVPSPSLNDDLETLTRILNQNRDTLKKMIDRLLLLFGEKETPAPNQVHASIRSALISFKIIEQLIPLISLKGGSAVFSDEEGDICACINATIKKGTEVFLAKELEKAKEKERMKKKYKCYIATLCYGDNAPIYVPVFQQFRDEILKRSAMGRGFISLYYLLSPHLVIYLTPFPRIQHTIRTLILDACHGYLLRRKKREVS